MATTSTSACGALADPPRSAARLKLVGDDGVDQPPVHVVEAHDLIAADGEAGLADGGAGRALGLGRDVERDQDDERNGEQESGEDQPGDLVGARLVDRQPLGELLGTATLAGLRGWPRRAAAADVRGAHASASSISRSTSSP